MRRHNEMLPYSVRTASRFLTLSRPKMRAKMIDGKLCRYSPCQSRSRSGVKYNRLMRLRRRLLA